MKRLNMGVSKRSPCRAPEYHVTKDELSEMTSMLHYVIRAVEKMHHQHWLGLCLCREVIPDHLFVCLMWNILLKRSLFFLHINQIKVDVSL